MSAAPTYEQMQQIIAAARSHSLTTAEVLVELRAIRAAGERLSPPPVSLTDVRTMYVCGHEHTDTDALACLARQQRLLAKFPALAKL